MSRSVKSVAVIGAAAVFTLLAAGTASAHVTVNPKSTEGGGYTQLTFRLRMRKQVPGSPS